MQDCSSSQEALFGVALEAFLSSSSMALSNTTIQVAGLIRWHGDKTSAEIVRRLRCMFCRRRPTFPSLVPMSASDTAMKHGGGWSIMLTVEGAAV
jgi:hypothetical protein